MLWLPMACADQRAGELEEPVCGWLKERLVFALWSFTAGRPDPDAWRSVAGAEPVTYRTRDGRVLRGYRIAAQAQSAVAGGRPIGFMLFAQGNAMLADQLLGQLRRFAELGVDVFIYDYRGYGRSDGRPRLKAIVSDYREIFQSLGRELPDGQKYLYGISFGGIVLLNVIGTGASFGRAVIDSAPSRISPFGCPPAYDPVVNVPRDASRLLVISGARDDVVAPAEQAELRRAAESRGARVVLSDRFAHPFMDRDPRTHREREELIGSFLFSHGSRRDR